MIFWFKKKQAVLDCFTPHSYIQELYPIGKASHHYPEWFTNLPKPDILNHDREYWTNMKKCVGFLNYFKESIAMPFWENAAIRYTQNNIRVDSQIGITTHDKSQFTGFLDDTYQHIKISTPWIFKANVKTKFIQTFPIWCYQSESILERIIHCPGITDFYYQHSTNVNLFLKRPTRITSESGILNAGVPLVFFTPLEDIKIKIKNHYVDSIEFENLKKSYPGMPGKLSAYFIAKRDRDKADKQKKCPFHFK